MNFSLWKKKTAQKSIPSNHTIDIKGRTLTYTLIVGSRAKRMRITIYPGGDVRITAPKKASSRAITTCIVEKSAWIFSRSEHYKTLLAAPKKAQTKKEYAQYKGEALRMVTEAVKKYNTLYNFIYKDIRIKNQKTLWGSCSRQGNLNFNYKLALLNESLRDYVVVHELCHLQEFNHSPQFWDLVAKTIPNHKDLRKELKETGLRSK
jgi:predicted metal-dependent hydrolase